MARPPEPKWLLLIHQIPPNPAYLRVKVGRRLQQLGAVAVKNSVYVLPSGNSAREDLQWILQEIVQGGGEASICEARFLYGLSDLQIETLFRSARKADYDEVAAEARALEEAFSKQNAKTDEATRAQLETEVMRLSKRLSQVSAIDFFGMSEREVVAGLISGIQARLKPEEAAASSSAMAPGKMRGLTWVTRKGIHVDRMASAWLIRRFIDKNARFKYVPAKGYRSLQGELRFDMFEGEYTHEGDRCTFEVLRARFSLEDPALTSIAEIVHDIDLKDGKFQRPDAVGFERLINGIAAAHGEDEVRLSRACAVLDDLYAYFKGA
ncbi:MAG: chromate resistance protein ChrB domain-containing protein [Spirochaetia bacterium]|jgi:hypothetical protein